MPEPFKVRLTVRSYDIDARGHLNGIVYYQYAEHVRWAFLRAAAISEAELLTQGISPVNLETTIRYHREVRAEDEIDVSCTFIWGNGKSFRVEQKFRLPDGTLVAELWNTGGLLNLESRKLLSNPGEKFRSLAAVPQVFDL